MRVVLSSAVLAVAMAATVVAIGAGPAAARRRAASGALT